MKYHFLLKAALTTLLLLISFNGSSAIIESRGYSLDTSTNIITGGELEWLNWDETISMSVANVYDSPLFSGWRLATSGEMYELLNTFFGPNLAIDTSLNSRQRLNGDFGAEFGEDFFALFTGFMDNDCGTSQLGCLTNPRNQAQAMYGEEGALRMLIARDDFDWGNDSRGFFNAYGYLQTQSGPSTIYSPITNTAIALVRGIGSTSTQPPASVAVSEPNQLIFFSVFLLVVLRFKSASE
ncbi:hypothetical protein [Alteromonas macleodii]|uniref:hypothetical protein n=1 Tax=Alteromonas TaxID=226 RepID=UPI00066B05BE|nr:hypothetical protein [Alteromonas macleodii]CAI3966901.1 hypothetical protein MIT1002_03410 [Alteromonas macleodii]VTP55325.1 hypothetical protein MIT1002_03410 [Alteromonas macleodii]